MTATAEQLRATERWFYRRGLPFFVEDYRSSTDVWTRAVPFLAGALVVMVLLASVYSDDPRLAIAGLASALILLGIYAIVNVRRGRRWNALPHRVTWPVLAGFVAVPTVVAIVADGSVGAILQAVGLAVLLLVLTWVVIRYAIIPVLTWATRYTFRGISDLYRLATRALPLMLLFITFLFINTEVWQVAGPLVGSRLWAVIGLFAVLGIVFILGRVPAETRLIESTTSTATVVAACERTPLAGVAASVPGLDEPVPLSRRQWANVGLVMTVAQLVQVTLFALVVWAFFVVLGILAIPVELQSLWLDGLTTVTVLWEVGGGHGVTWELLRTATFLGAFAGFYVTVYTATDSVYRETFYDRIRSDLERSLCVRRVYVALRARAQDPAA